MFRSFEAFIDAVGAINNGESKVSDFSESLATISTTYRTTAILEAGRLSLDTNKTISIEYADDSNYCRPTGLKPIGGI